MTLVLDAGALIAIDRGDRRTAGVVRAATIAGQAVRTHGGVVGQAWRDGARQALLAKVLRSVEVVPLGAGLGRDAGLLLATSGGTDVIDAALVCIANDGDTIITSDPGDIADLVAASGLRVAVRTP